MDNVRLYLTTVLRTECDGAPFRPKDSVRAMLIVWRRRWNMTKTALCFVVYDSNVQRYATDVSGS